jgi:hypothetical protein
VTLSSPIYSPELNANKARSGHMFLVSNVLPQVGYPETKRHGACSYRILLGFQPSPRCSARGASTPTLSLTKRSASAILSKTARPKIPTVSGDSYNRPVNTDFLDRLATQLKAKKSAACGRAIQRILASMKKDYEAGRYKNHAEAENEFRKLIEHEKFCGH